jgi:hypothetical protein
VSINNNVITNVNNNNVKLNDVLSATICRIDGNT